MSSLENRKPLSPDGFAGYMADVIANNPDDLATAQAEGVKLMGAVLVDLGYAEGVLMFGEMQQWYESDE